MSLSLATYNLLLLEPLTQVNYLDFFILDDVFDLDDWLLQDLFWLVRETLGKIFSRGSIHLSLSTVDYDWKQLTLTYSNLGQIFPLCFDLGRIWLASDSAQITAHSISPNDNKLFS